jgi:hypothetical protein
LDSGDDEDAAHPTTVTQGLEEGAEVVVGVKRRPSTTEAKKRVPLDDGEDEEHQQQRPQVQRAVSDPFESPVESSGDDSSDDSENSGEELSFGR